MDSLEIVRVGPDFVAKHWGTLVQAFSEMALNEEGQEPTHAHLNSMLAGFQSGALVLWVAVSDTTVYAMFVTSKFVGGPVSGWILYLSYLIGMDKLSKAVWVKGMMALKKYMDRENCTAIMAHTSKENVKLLAEALGAKVDYRLTWRM